MEGAGAFYTQAFHDIADDTSAARRRHVRSRQGADADQPYNAVEFMFPHFFLLPIMGSMASLPHPPADPGDLPVRDLGPVIRPEGEPYDTPSEPTVLPYNSPDFPEIPRQDYSNLPIQQLGLHNLDYMRIGGGYRGDGGEGLISNYQRLIDGYLAGLPSDVLRRGQNVVNCGFNAAILDIGF